MKKSESLASNVVKASLDAPLSNPAYELTFNSTAMQSQKETPKDYNGDMEYICRNTMPPQTWKHHQEGLN